jgi:hypothetical protein
MRTTGRVHVDTEPRVKGEPTGERMQGHRVHTGRCGTLLYVDIYRYSGGEVYAYARRRPGMETVQGDSVVLVEFSESYDACVQRHLDNEMSVDRYTGDHPLSPAPGA